MKKALALLLCTAMTAGMLAGCGSKTAETTASTETAASTEAADGSSEAAENTSDKKWVVATDTVFKPFEYTNDKNEFVGIDVDLLAAIAEDQGFEYELQSLGWDAGVAAVQAGQADALIAGATIKQERIDSGWIFSDGYYNATQTFVVSEDSDIASYEDLKGKNVAVKNGTAGADFANSLKDEYGFTVTVFEDSPTMYQAVVGGQVAACFDDTPIMASNIKDTGIGMEIVDGTGNDPAAYGFAIFNADNQELIDMFNKGLANIKANGTYDEIIAKYLGE